jgi:hypothetical protein
MSTPNAAEVQITRDDAKITVVKVVAYYTAATNSNTTIVQANTLAWANTSAPCVVSIAAVQYAAGLANGYVSLQWAAGGAATNNDILIFGGKTSSQFVNYIPNPLAANTANLNHGLGGDINLYVSGAEPFDSYSLIITLNKEGDAGGGYANAYPQYNDSWFGLQHQPA